MERRRVLSAPERFGIRKTTELKEPLGATRSASCLLACHLFLHLLLHFLRCGFCPVRCNHPSVTLGIDNDTAAIAPKHIHHFSLGSGTEFYSLGNSFICVLRQQIQT